MITLSRELAIPVLIGRGLTEPRARTTLANAKARGFDRAIVGTKTLPVSYAAGKFTIGGPS
jgi:hypothetical protein